MWRLIAKEGISKTRALRKLGWDGRDYYPDCECWLCQYVYEQKGAPTCCKTLCPISEGEVCGCERIEDHPYHQYCLAINTKEAAQKFVDYLEEKLRDW